MPQNPLQEHWHKVLSDWKSRIAAFQQVQYEKAILLDRRHYLLGVPAALFAAVAGTTVFATLNKDYSIAARVTVATFTIFTATLAALQTFLNYGKRAEKHRSVSSQFGSIRRQIDILEADLPPTISKLKQDLRALDALISKISDDAPLISPTETMPDITGGLPYPAP